jgi:hypothetical protein
MRTSLCFGLLVSLSLSACVEDGALPEELAASEEALELQTGPEIGPGLPTLNLCTTGPADATLYVGSGYAIPPSALPFTQKSAHGGYAYDDKGCGRYVVDVKVGSNMAGIPLELTTSAHDLPGSSAAGGTMPANAYDCGQYRRHETYWHRKGEGAWTVLGTASYKGVWSYGVCASQRYSGTVYGLFGFGPTPGAGWDTYRVAVQVKARATAQQVKVTLGKFVEPPA